MFLASRKRFVATAVVSVVLATAGCRSGTAAPPAEKPANPAATTTETESAASPIGLEDRSASYVIAEARAEGVDLYRSPGDAAPSQRLAQPTPSGGPLVFLVVESRADGWLRVDLPVRPNGSTAWARADALTLLSSPYRIEVRLADHSLTVFAGSEVVLREPIGVGHEPTPTPGGRFYLYELLRPPDPTGAYGPYAFGLSGFSETLTSFGAGDGRLGIHGTDDPASIGADVTHGCIRLTNAAVTQLAETVPLGTPVLISR